MKRNMELVRGLLLLAEADGDNEKLCAEYGNDVVAGHVAIMKDAGLVEAAVALNSYGKPCACEILRLTWKGHEFLDNARNDTVWNKVVTRVKDTVATVSFDVLAELLKGDAISLLQG